MSAVTDGGLSGKKRKECFGVHVGEGEGGIHV